jgi:chromate transporter
MTPDEKEASAPSGLVDLFFTFTWLALRGFGGVLPVAQAALVEEKKWLNLAQFRELLSFGQVLPGPNVCNLALMIGDRFFGLRGALVALAGMLAVPAVVVMSLALIYAQLNTIPMVRDAMDGMAAVAAGLMVGTAIKLARGIHWGWMVGAALAFVAVAGLRLHLGWVLLVMLPVLIGLAWRQKA